MSSVFWNFFMYAAKRNRFECSHIIRSQSDMWSSRRDVCNQDDGGLCKRLRDDYITSLVPSAWIEKAAFRLLDFLSKLPKWYNSNVKTPNWRLFALLWGLLRGLWSERQNREIACEVLIPAWSIPFSEVCAYGASEVMPNGIVKFCGVAAKWS